MSEGKGIAVSALILAIIAAGLGGYVFFDETLAPMLGLEEPASNIETFYDEAFTSQLSSASVWQPLPDILLNITTTEIVDLYISFTCYVYYDTNNPGTTTMLSLYLDESDLTTGTYAVVAFNESTRYQRFCVSMQEYYKDLPVGTHNVSVWVKVDDTSTIFYHNALFAQTTT